ncbi:DUF4436 family protein [Pseudonocardia sp. GCM10023141]|uniref:DUF4436 family protein n=1 Tax=Pseudonocardia sp. GCM10023141 TaxID=3252653 RepID=UPI003616B81A
MPDPDPAPVPAPTASRHRWAYVAGPLAVALAIGIGAAGFYGEFASRDVEYSIPADAPSPDTVSVLVTVQRIEPAAREMVLQVLVVPKGANADAGEPAAPSRDLVLDTSSLTTAPLTFRAHERITARELRVPLDGVVSFFPFDSYRGELYVGVDAAGEPAPVQLFVTDHDPGFVSAPVAQQSDTGYASAALRVTRSRSTYILAWFQLIVMWALGLSVLAGAVHIVRRRLGLVWPAMGWMAATLFALVGFRNAAPGLPPIGSLIDYCAFFWAEAIITLSLVLVIVQGVRARR